MNWIVIKVIRLYFVCFKILDCSFHLFLLWTIYYFVISVDLIVGEWYIYNRKEPMCLQRGTTCNKNPAKHHPCTQHSVSILKQASFQGNQSWQVCHSFQVYLLVLSVTTLSLLLAPVLWWVTTHRLVPLAERKTVTWQDQNSPEENSGGTAQRLKSLYSDSLMRCIIIIIIVVTSWQTQLPPTSIRLLPTKNKQHVCQLIFKRISFINKCYVNV